MQTVRFIEDIIGKEILLAQEMKQLFKQAGHIAVKLHYGEQGNRTSLKPIYARTVVSALKSIGMEPFLFDSSVMYGGPRGRTSTHRANAEKQGFTESSVGCPLIFNDESVMVKTEHMGVEVCKPLADADSIVALSHVKGHPCSGFGGAIKNFGMGGVSKKTKVDIHSMAAPVYLAGCEGCGLCEKICPAGGLRVVNNNPQVGSCWGCDACVLNCPNHCFKVKIASFDRLLSEAAGAVIKGKKVFYINIMKDMTRFCDCMSDPGPVVLHDVGIVLGTDIVAIDKACFDLINNEAGKDLFKVIHHKSPLLHITEASQLAMGSLDYALVK